MTSLVAKVKREKLVACMTCPICNKLMTEATTICECLHSFCRKCIYEKIKEEELNRCPVCYVSLGCAPLEKLRPDHNLQDLREKIFPSGRTKAKAPENIPSEGTDVKAPEILPSEGTRTKSPEICPFEGTNAKTTIIPSGGTKAKATEVLPSSSFPPPAPLPSKRKERSISSLVVSTPRVSTQISVTGRRTKSAGRKVHASLESTLSIKRPIKRAEDHPENTSPPETLIKIIQNTRQNLSTAESSKQHMPNKGKEEITKTLEGKNDSLKPSNFPIEAASKPKSSKTNLKGSVFKSESPHFQGNEAHVPKAKNKEHDTKSKVHDDENGSTPMPSGSVTRRRVRSIQQRIGAASEPLNIPAQAVVDASSTCKNRIVPIWFSLVAKDYQKGEAPLLQIPPCYLRIKDRNLPVSSIKKYAAKKLDLSGEAEVELRLRGQPVVTALQLHDLIDLWLQTMPASERIHTSVGGSAEEFLMVLSYGQKAQHP